VGDADLAAHQKKARTEGWFMIFADETGFSLQPPVMPHTWAVRGQTPFSRHRMRHWAKLSALVAVAPNPHVWVHLVRRAAVSADVIRFIQAILRSLPRRRVMLLWDGIGPHWSKRTRRALAVHRERLRVYRLPAYAPELNPVEGANGWTKGGLRGLCPNDDQDLVVAIRRQVRRLRRRPHIIRSFFRRPRGLSFA
jgi:transposase